MLKLQDRGLIPIHKTYISQMSQEDGYPAKREHHKGSFLHLTDMPMKQD